ncbi:MAG: hypothetical protein ACT4QE_22080 [Anaerolineales bacterium]
MSMTRGPAAKRRSFAWHFDPMLKRVLVENDRGRRHEFTLQEIQEILRVVHGSFGTSFFPLANNVQKLGDGTEKWGLGSIILEQEESDVSHAQGSSYLGVILEESGYFVWNGRHKGIEWKLITADLSDITLLSRFSNHSVS